MQASDYLKMKFQSDRQLAVYSQQGVTSTWKAMQGIGTDIYSGVECASWYSSCLIPLYHDVCKQLLSEEKRMLLFIRSIYRYKDVIAHMFYLYFQTVTDDTKNGNTQKKVRSTNSMIAKVITTIPISKVTRLGLATALSESLSMANLVSKTVIEKLAARIPNVIWLFQLFGTDQQCALAARRLKTLDPKYYAILYKNELEMVYYFIEPVMTNIIKNVQMNLGREFDEIYNIIKREYYV